jgi:membrane protein implicated in regulation of membrane protease activity
MGKPIHDKIGLWLGIGAAFLGLALLANSDTKNGVYFLIVGLVLTVVSVARIRSQREAEEVDHRAGDAESGR